MACEFDCIYKNLALGVQAEIGEVIDQNEEWTQQQDEAARRGWGDYAARRNQDERHRSISKIDEMLEIDGLLCDEFVCGFAMESVRKHMEEINFDIKSRREQL